jgi:hypothetical protein
VEVLVNGVRAAGRCDARFGGRRIAAGIYLLRFVTPEGAETRRFAIVP